MTTEHATGGLSRRTVLQALGGGLAGTGLTGGGAGQSGLSLSGRIISGIAGDSGPVQPGDRVAVSLTVSNGSDRTMEQVICEYHYGGPCCHYQGLCTITRPQPDLPLQAISDQYDDGATWEPASWEWATIGPGESRTPTLEFIVPESAAPGTYELGFQAIEFGRCGRQNTTAPTDGATVSFPVDTVDPSLTFGVDTDGPVRPGGTVTVGFTVSNEGDGVAERPGINLLEAVGREDWEPGCTAADCWQIVDTDGDGGQWYVSDGFWGVDSIAPGETYEPSVTYRVPTSVDPGEYEIETRLRAGSSQRSSVASNTPTITVSAARPTITTSTRTVTAGDRAPIEVELENPGDRLYSDLSLRYLGSSGSPAPIELEPETTIAAPLASPPGQHAQRTERIPVVEDATEGRYTLEFDLRDAAGDTLDDATATLPVDNAPHVITDLEESYAAVYDRALNASWWEEEAENASEEALDALAPSFEGVSLEALATTVGELAGSTMASVATGLVTLLDQLTSLFVALRRSAVASAMEAPDYDEVRAALDGLIEQTEALSSVGGPEQRDELLAERSRTLDTFQGRLQQYLLGVSELIRGNGSVRVGDAPGLGYEEYRTVRAIVEHLRLLTVFDSAATRSWLDAESATADPTAPQPLPYALFREGRHSRLLASMNEPDDYLLLELRIEEGYDNPELGIDIEAPASLLDAGIQVVQSPSRPNPDTPAGNTFERTASNRLTIRARGGPGTYYVLISADGVIGGPLELTAWLREEGWFSARERVPIHVLEQGWRTTDSDGDRAGDSSSLDSGYEAVETVDDGQQRVRVTPDEPQRYAVDLSAGERLVAGVDEDAAEDVHLYVDRLDGGVPREVASTASDGRRGEVVVDAADSDRYYVSVYANREATSGATVGGGTALAQSGSAVETTLSIQTMSADRPLPKAIVDWSGEPAAGEELTLDGSPSIAPVGTIDTYEWDLDGDGTFERTGESIAYQPRPSGDAVRLRVTDDAGQTAVTVVRFDVEGEESSGSETGGTTGPQSQESDDSGAGFGLGTAVGALGGVGTLLARRLGTDE